MKKLILLTFALAIFFLSESQACSCYPIPDFVGPYHDDDVIVRAKKLADIRHGMKIEISEQLSGKPAKTKEVMVWGGSGARCRVGTQGFEIGKEFIFRLLPNPDPLPSYNSYYQDADEKSEDYSMNLCTIYYMNIENEMVIHNSKYNTIDGKHTTMPYSSFRKLYNNGLDLPITIGQSIEESNLIIRLENGTEIPETGGQIQLFSLDGKLNRTLAIISQERQTYILDYRGLSSGVYLVRVQLGDMIQMKKVILLDQQ